MRAEIADKTRPVARIAAKQFDINLIHLPVADQSNWSAYCDTSSR